MISEAKKQLLHTARVWGHKPEFVEKVFRLLEVFDRIMSAPFLQERLVLKGGTALNLFHFDGLPRLSVDIDLNYIGALDQKEMLVEQSAILDMFQALVVQEQLVVCRRSNMGQIGGKIELVYPGLLGQNGTLDIDISFLYREPLYPTQILSAKVEGYQHVKGNVLDIHEVVAGKLSALFDRSVSRDWFDAHHVLLNTALDNEKLRSAFVTYIAMTNIDLSTIKAERIDYNFTELNNKLLSLLRRTTATTGGPDRLHEWAATKISELRQALSAVLPFKENEILFIHKIRNEGVIAPELITSDSVLSAKIISHPYLHWCIEKRKK